MWLWTELPAKLSAYEEMRELCIILWISAEQTAISVYSITCIKHQKNLVFCVLTNKHHLLGYGVTQYSPRKN